MRATSSSLCLLALLLAACAGDDGGATPGSGGASGSGGAGSIGGASASGGASGGAGGMGGTGGGTGDMSGGTSASGGTSGGAGGMGGTGGATGGTGGMAGSDAGVTDPIEVDADGSADWPSTQPITGVDMEGIFGSEVSGLTLQPASSGARVLWASTNAMQARAYRLVESDGVWSNAQADGWSAGKRLYFPDGMGVPDAESIAMAEQDNEQLYVVSERDLGGGFSLESLPAIYRYDAAGDASELIATDAWELTASLPGLDGNAGPEALTWIPDALLVASDVIDDNTGMPYAPDDYAGHGTGLFVVGIEASGTLHVFALAADGASTEITTIETELAGVMGLELDRETGYLYAHCDDGCDNATVVFPVADAFSRRVLLRRPEGLPNLNYEGIAIAAEAECTNGEKPFFWVEDGVNTHVLQEGTIRCGLYL